MSNHTIPEGGQNLLDPAYIVSKWQEAQAGWQHALAMAENLKRKCDAMYDALVECLDYIEPQVDGAPDGDHTAGHLAHRIEDVLGRCDEPYCPEYREKTP